MVCMKIDERIKTLIENGVITGHRSMFIIVGKKAKEQIVHLHYILKKSTVKAVPSILWCYKNKKSLGFSSHQTKRMKKIAKRNVGSSVADDQDNLFDSFIISADFQYCYYKDTHKILGNTYGMCVLQDFEALTPNLLARTIETVEGGGLIIFLLESVTSLKQLYTLNMDVHKRFRTEAHQDIVCRFNERFLLSIASCNQCLIIDDKMKVLPISSKNLEMKPVSKESIVVNDSELDALKESFQDTQPVGVLINCCKTVDQAKALLKFIDVISEKSMRSTVSLTAARGRGKSATLGLAIAAAVAFGYSSIYISSPSPENLKTLFTFIKNGFAALSYDKATDYEEIKSTNPEFRNATVRINIGHSQRIQYIHPTDAHKLGLANLLVIDEAAAIPLPYVKAMMGSCLTFLSSTINGYEGTGRSLSLKLISQLRSETQNPNNNKNNVGNVVTGRQLHEVTLDESIRYKPGDQVEQWLTELLCLNITNYTPSISGFPLPEACQLYYINRDTLFSYHKASELFLQKLVSLYVASHYKNSPNDLQMMSDAPAHHLFCLLGPVNDKQKSLPEVIVFIQVCLEGEINEQTVDIGLRRNERAAGDLIPWTISQQFEDNKFSELAGARIIRIATHPEYCGKGYGSQALKLLKQYYQMEIPNIDEKIDENVNTISDDDKISTLEEAIAPRNSLPPLLLKLSERKPEHLDYLGVSYGVTLPLLKFWKRSNFVPLYLRQTTNDITGEHSCIMLYKLKVNNEEDESQSEWLEKYWLDFRRRFINLLSYAFATYSSELAINLLYNNTFKVPSIAAGKNILESANLTLDDLKRLKTYCNNMADYHFIMDLMPSLARVFFLNLMNDVDLRISRATILLGIGLQHKTIDNLTEELKLSAPQTRALFSKTVKTLYDYLNGVAESTIERMIFSDNPHSNNEIKVDLQNGKSMQNELESAAEELKRQQKMELEKLKKENLSQYAIKGTDEDWNPVLSGKGSKSLISIKTGTKRLNTSDDKEVTIDHRNKGKKKKNNRSK